MSSSWFLLFICAVLPLWVQAGDDLLLDEAPITIPAPKKETKTKPAVEASPDPHLDVMARSKYPSAKECSTCHQQIYDEWRVSNHAYASISPMFHKFEQKITDLTQGSIANFCVRCHASVGTTLKEGRELPLWERSPVGREGVTCITCHRVNEKYSKVNGERRITPGDIHEPMYGPTDAKALQEVLAQKDFYKVALNGAETGMPIHKGVVKFETISKSQFCMSCHQVAVQPGIKLEVVWDQYRDSPAHKKGISCQECHMGKVPGKAEGWATGAAAVLNGKEINPGRKHANHSFYGPGYPIAHPGIFPHNPRAENYKIDEWLKFDYRSDWGTPAFEKQVEAGKIKPEFPKEWRAVEDRIAAREIVDENTKLLEKKKEQRLAVMENGSRIDGPFLDSTPKINESLKFHFRINNINSGHNLPSGSLGAQPELWMNVSVVSPSKKIIFESGYVDSAGDMADLHSEDVQFGRLPHDNQLFNLQTKFLTNNLKGTDREMFLPVNFDFDQRPFIRPAGAPNSVLNHPFGARMESRSIPPEGYKIASYKVPAKYFTEKGTYKISVRMRSRAEPIYFMKFVEATDDMIRSMNSWMIDMHPHTVEFVVGD